MDGDIVALLSLIAVLLAVALGVLLYIYYGRIIIRSRVAGAPVEFRRMLGMTASGIDAHKVVTAYIDARKAGVDVSLDTLQQQVKEKADVFAFVQQLIINKRSAPHGTERNTP